MSQIVNSAPKVLGFANRAVVKAAVTGLFETIQSWMGRRRSRIALSRLQDHLIRDIGLDALSRDTEASKYFWN